MNRLQILAVGNLHLDAIRHVVRRGGQHVDLAPREFAVLEFLMRHAGSPVTRQDLLRHAWDLSYPGPARTVDVCIRRLRAKVDDPWPQALIQTVRGTGYRLIAPRSR